MSERERISNLPEDTDARAVQDLMVARAERAPMPERFVAHGVDDRARMEITDLETGREVQVSLHAYQEVRKVLTALFGKDGSDE